MPITIARGPSVNLYARNKLKKCIKSQFSFGVNGSALDFSTDIVVATDFQWIIDNHAALAKLGHPIITRDWSVLHQEEYKDLDLVFLPNAVVLKARLSGMVATKICDSFSAQLGQNSYVLGIDHTIKHYDQAETACQPIPEVAKLDDYALLHCNNTINLGGHLSMVTCWPKRSKLPVDPGPDDSSRAIAYNFIRQHATEMFQAGL